MQGACLSTVPPAVSAQDVAGNLAEDASDYEVGKSGDRARRTAGRRGRKAESNARRPIPGSPLPTREAEKTPPGPGGGAAVGIGQTARVVAGTARRARAVARAQGQLMMAAEGSPSPARLAVRGPIQVLAGQARVDWAGPREQAELASRDSCSCLPAAAGVRRLVQLPRCHLDGSWSWSSWMDTRGEPARLTSRILFFFGDYI